MTTRVVGGVQFQSSFNLPFPTVWLVLGVREEREREREHATYFSALISLRIKKKLYCISILRLPRYFTEALAPQQYIFTLSFDFLIRVRFFKNLASYSICTYTVD